MTIGSTYKPRSVRSWLDETSKAIIGTIIHLDPTSPRGSSSLPEARKERAAPRPHKRVLPLLGLAPGGGCLAVDIAAGAGGLLHHLFTLASKACALRRSFSVALSPGYPDRVLPGTMLFRARTFLKRHSRPRLPGRPNCQPDHTLRFPRRQPTSLDAKRNDHCS